MPLQCSLACPDCTHSEADWSSLYPVHCAAQLGDVALLQSRLDVTPGFDLNSLDDDSWTASHYAVFYSSDGHAAALELLLARGAAVDARNGQSATPLHLAAGTGAINNVRILLAAGADREARNAEKQRPIDLLRELKPDGWQAIESMLLA